MRCDHSLSDKSRRLNIKQHLQKDIYNCGPSPPISYKPDIAVNKKVDSKSDSLNPYRRSGEQKNLPLHPGVQAGVSVSMAEVPENAPENHKSKEHEKRTPLLFHKKLPLGGIIPSCV